MADSCEEKCSETAEEKDEELDELLDSALEDFSDKHTGSKPGQSTPQPSVNSASESSSDCPSAATTGGQEEALFEELFSNVENHVDKDKLEETVGKLLGGNEEFMKQLSELTEAAASAAGNPQGPSTLADLETQLKRTMDDLAKNACEMEGAGLDDDFMRAMSEFGLASDEGGGMDFVQVMQGMMQNLLSKDVLYPALKELNEKYPAWLEANRNTLKHEEYTRYKNQFELVQQICKEYESDNNISTEEEKTRRFNTLMDLMQKMQESGNPPPELLNQNPVSEPEIPIDLRPVKPGEECKPM